MKVIKAIVFGIILLFINLLSFGQSNSSVYSKRMKEVYTDPNIQIQSLLDSADFYLRTNRNKAFFFLEQAYLLSLKSENQHQQYLVYRKLGHYYEYYQQPDLAAVNYEKSLSGKQANQQLQFTYMLMAGKQYQLARQSRKSLQLYQQYNRKRGGNPREQMQVYEAFGDAYFALNINDSAYHYYLQAEAISAKLQLIEENTLIKLKMAKALSDNNKTEALEVLNEANAQSKTKGSKKLQLTTESDLAEYYQQNNLGQQEIATRNTIIGNLETNKTELESMDVDVDAKKQEEQINIAKSYNKQNKFEEAINMLADQITAAKTNDSKNQLELKKEAAKTRSEAYLKSGQEQKALESYEEYVALLDQLYQQKELEYNNVNELNSQLSEHQWRIDFLEKDKAIYDAELRVLEQERQLHGEKITYKNRYIALLAIVISLLIFALIMIYQRYKIQQKHNLFLDLKSLRTQMNPHFIFNALNSVNSFIAKNDELNANKYLVRFSKLMRSILDNSDMDFIPLEKEIEILELYLQLENMRFSDKFNFTFTVDPTLASSHFEIPPMLIQPYIENAVWHGLRYKENNGMLQVSIEKENKGIKVMVEDNGIGRKKSMELKTKNQQASKSLGIKNTTKRLELLTKIYKQEIRQEIADVELSGEGTRVTLWIPNLKKNA